MIFIDRSYKIDEYGYVEAVFSYEDYSKIAPLIPQRKVITSTRTTFPLIDNNELEVIIPDWIYELRKELSETVNSLTGESNSHLLELSGNKLINELTCLDRSVSIWYDTLAEIEETFKTLYLEDELNPCNIKDILPLCTALHFTLHGVDEDYWENEIWSRLKPNHNG